LAAPRTGRRHRLADDDLGTACDIMVNQLFIAEAQIQGGRRLLVGVVCVAIHWH
jgi:hypothetical protein